MLRGGRVDRDCLRIFMLHACTFLGEFGTDLRLVREDPAGLWQEEMACRPTSRDRPITSLEIVAREGQALAELEWDSGECHPSGIIASGTLLCL